MMAWAPAGARTLPSWMMKANTSRGVFGAACRLIPHFDEGWIHTPFYGNELISQSVSALLFVALCGYVWFRSLRRS